NGTAASPMWYQVGVDTLPPRYCTWIAIDPANANHVYLTFTGFTHGNVWRTLDGGTTWTDISGNLPDVAVNTIAVHPHISNYRYLGSQIGAFASADGGANWSPSNDGPANVSVQELFWMGDALGAATFGRGFYMLQPVVWVQFGLANPGNGTYSLP